MSKKKYFITGSIVGTQRGQVVELTEEQAKSGVWAGRVQMATVVTVGDPSKEQELIESLKMAGKVNADLQHQLDSEARQVENLQAELEDHKAKAKKSEAELKTLADQLAEAQARADKAEAELKDRDKAQLEIATPAAASSKK